MINIIINKINIILKKESSGRATIIFCNLACSTQSCRFPLLFAANMTICDASKQRNDDVEVEISNPEFTPDYFQNGVN